jgi:hypothetical protein
VAEERDRDLTDVEREEARAAWDEAFAEIERKRGLPPGKVTGRRWSRIVASAYARTPDRRVGLTRAHAREMNKG